MAGPPQEHAEKETTCKGAQRQEIIKLLKQIKMSVSTFGSVIPVISNYLQSLCKMFRAGQVANHFAAWTEITNDKEIFSDITGVTIECTGIPEQQSIPRQISLSLVYLCGQRRMGFTGLF